MSVTLKMGAEPSNLVLGMSREIDMSAACSGILLEPQREEDGPHRSAESTKQAHVEQHLSQVDVGYVKAQPHYGHPYHVVADADKDETNGLPTVHCGTGGNRRGSLELVLHTRFWECEQRRDAAHHFGGNEPAYFAAIATHSLSWASVLRPADSTRIHPCIGRPVRSKRRV